MLHEHDREWFAHSVERIDTYYAPFGAERHAHCVLGMLCHEHEYVPEADIVGYVGSQIVVEDPKPVLDALSFLTTDHYLDRDPSDGHRKYRFKYRLMREWWRINRG
jgi:hypothetical protein